MKTQGTDAHEISIPTSSSLYFLACMLYAHYQSGILLAIVVLPFIKESSSLFNSSILNTLQCTKLFPDTAQLAPPDTVQLMAESSFCVSLTWVLLCQW